MEDSALVDNIHIIYIRTLVYYNTSHVSCDDRHVSFFFLLLKYNIY